MVASEDAVDERLFGVDDLFRVIVTWTTVEHGQVAAWPAKELHGVYGFFRRRRDLFFTGLWHSFCNVGCWQRLCDAGQRGADLMVLNFFISNS